MKYTEKDLPNGRSQATIEFTKMDFLEQVNNPFSAIERDAVDRAKKSGLVSDKLYVLVLFARRCEK